jgi:hypothetical protein
MESGYYNNNNNIRNLFFIDEDEVNKISLLYM